MKKKLAYYLSLFICLFLIASFATAQATKTPVPTRTPAPTKSPARTAETITKAIAVISSASGQNVQGTVTLTKAGGGIRIIAVINGLKPGDHGIHVHEFGDCSNISGGSAGAHFNPTNSKHGLPEAKERHVGDLGNIKADSSGQARYDRIDTVITFEGADSVIGRAIVIHDGEDDYTSQPGGNSGSPIACGVIGIAKS